MDPDVRIDDEWPLRLSSSAQVKAAEAQLGMRFPQGYEAFVTRFGEGVLEPSGLRVYPPERVLHEREAWRQRIDQYWFWDGGAQTLDKARARQCVMVADTCAGDEFIVHPDDSDVVYVLPRHSDEVFRIGGGLDGVITWLRTAGVLAEPHDALGFAAFPAGWNAPIVHLLQHVDPASRLRRDIGVFETEEQAERARAHMQRLHGFRRAVEGFEIVRMKLGALDWTNGYHEPDGA